LLTQVNALAECVYEAQDKNQNSHSLVELDKFVEEVHQLADARIPKPGDNTPEHTYHNQITVEVDQDSCGACKRHIPWDIGVDHSQLKNNKQH